MNYVELLDNDLYWSTTLPALICATYGGVSTADAAWCLEAMDCYGTGKGDKLAENTSPSYWREMCRCHPRSRSRMGGSRDGAQLMKVRLYHGTRTNSVLPPTDADEIEAKQSSLASCVSRKSGMIMVWPCASCVITRRTPQEVPAAWNTVRQSEEWRSRRWRVQSGHRHRYRQCSGHGHGYARLEPVDAGCVNRRRTRLRHSVHRQTPQNSWPRLQANHRRRIHYITSGWNRLKRMSRPVRWPQPTRSYPPSSVIFSAIMIVGALSFDQGRLWRHRPRAGPRRREPGGRVDDRAASNPCGRSRRGVDSRRVPQTSISSSSSGSPLVYMVRSMIRSNASHPGCGERVAHLQCAVNVVAGKMKFGPIPGAERGLYREESRVLGRAAAPPHEMPAQVHLPPWSSTMPGLRWMGFMPDAYKPPASRVRYRTLSALSGGNRESRVTSARV